jgi:hypothetical protein
MWLEWKVQGILTEFWSGKPFEKSTLKTGMTRFIVRKISWETSRCMELTQICVQRRTSVFAVSHLWVLQLWCQATLQLRQPSQGLKDLGAMPEVAVSCWQWSSCQNMLLTTSVHRLHEWQNLQGLNSYEYIFIVHCLRTVIPLPLPYLQHSEGVYSLVRYEDSGILRCYAVSTGKHLLAFRRFVTPYSAGSNSHRKVGNCLPIQTASHPSRLEPQISQGRVLSC